MYTKIIIMILTLKMLLIQGDAYDSIIFVVYFLNLHEIIRNKLQVMIGCAPEDGFGARSLKFMTTDRGHV